MSLDKKLIGYTKPAVEPNVPTSVDAALVRNIASNAFKDLTCRTIYINTYINDIAGAPWGALDANVVWKKSPYAAIHYDANNGTGSMADEATNIGIAFKLPQNGFTAPYGSDFVSWAIGSTEGTRKLPGENFAFDGETTVYAIWTHTWDDPIQEGNILQTGQFYEIAQTSNIVEVE